MKRFAGAVAAVGLSLAGAACGPESQATEGRVVGFEYRVDAQVLEDTWVHHQDEDGLPWSVPRDKIANTYYHEEFTGCEEVDNSVQPEDFVEFNAETGQYEDYYDSYYWDYDEYDDDECYFDSWCNSDEYSHCEAVYETLVDYDQLVTNLVRDCRAPSSIQKVKPQEPQINSLCLELVTPGQQVELTQHYIVQISAKNPFYDSENNPREVIVSEVEISADTWNDLEYSSKIPVKVTENQKIVLSS